MSDTSFVNSVTLTDSDWFNDVNRLHYTIFGDPANLAAIQRLVSPTLVAAQASTSGTAITFTGIPAGVKRINVMFNGVSTNGTSGIAIQLGDSGGIETTGYLCNGVALANAGATAVTASTAGFPLVGAAAAGLIHGVVTFTLANSAAFTWTAHGQVTESANPLTMFTSGRKSLSAELTQLSIVTGNGSDTFDAGSISISYE